MGRKKGGKNKKTEMTVIKETGVRMIQEDFIAVGTNFSNGHAKAEPQHAERAHAILSPSARERWSVCTGTVLAKGSGETSDYAKEGTYAHEWIEKAVAQVLDAKTNDEAKKQAGLILSFLLNIDPEDLDFKATASTLEEMYDYVTDYLLWLRKVEQLFRTKPGVTGFKRLTEYKVTYNEFNWGTMDQGWLLQMDGRYTAVICDFKYGKGVQKDATDNDQLLDYLCCLDQTLFDKKQIRLYEGHIFIYQPRTALAGEKPYTTMYVDNERLKAERIRLREHVDAASLVYQGKEKPNFRAGEHCRFCPAHAQCPARLNSINEQALLALGDDEFTVPTVELLSIDQLLRIYSVKKELEHFLDDVGKYLVKLKNDGEDLPLKLVAGKSNRKWIEDEEAVVAYLEERGADPYKRKLIGIGDAERAVGKLPESLTRKSQPPRHLVPLDDPRPEITGNSYHAAAVDALTIEA